MRNLATFVTAIGLFLASLPVALAGPPTDTVREYTDAVQKVLEDPALRKEERQGRLAQEADKVRRAEAPGSNSSLEVSLVLVLSYSSSVVSASAPTLVARAM